LAGSPIRGSARNALYRFAGSAQDQAKIVPWSLVLKVVPASTSDDEPSAWFYWKREILERNATLHEFELARADEARRLLRSL